MSLIRMISLASNFLIPLVIFYIIGYGILNREKVYDIFVGGVKDGFQIVVNIAPTLVGLMVSVGIVRTSGALDLLARILKPIGQILKIPAEVLPLILVRMFSTSAANGLVLDLFKEFGTDSQIGLMASIIMSCTESLFYIMSVYFLAVGIKKTRWTLVGGLIASIAGIAASVVLVRYMGC